MYGKIFNKFDLADVDPTTAAAVEMEHSMGFDGPTHRTDARTPGSKWRRGFA